MWENVWKPRLGTLLCFFCAFIVYQKPSPFQWKSLLEIVIREHQCTKIVTYTHTLNKKSRNFLSLARFLIESTFIIGNTDLEKQFSKGNVLFLWVVKGKELQGHQFCNNKTKVFVLWSFQTFNHSLLFVAGPTTVWKRFFEKLSLRSTD